MPRAAPIKTAASQENCFESVERNTNAIGIGREQHETMPPNSALHKRPGGNAPDQKQQIDEEVDKLKWPLKTNSNKANKLLEVQHQKSNQSQANEKQQQQAEQLAQSLRSAANAGKVELVRLLLKCGADPNAQDAEFGDTPLHLAAWQGFSETVQVLCKHRANTNVKNKAQFTPLHMACQQGHNQTARLLLMANAKTELKNSYGDTPLHTATRYGHAGVARILLSAKCNPNQVTLNNDTPLHIAAARGRRKLTKILMQHGAELVIKNKQNETAMDIALRLDLIEIQELIANPPPKGGHRQARNVHHHHHHHNHHHHTLRHNERYERTMAQVVRHRKSMTNLISAESGANDKGKQRHGLSISSNNVQQQHCAVAANLVRPATNRRRLQTVDDENQHEDDDQKLLLGPIGTSHYNHHRTRSSSQDFHNIGAVGSPQTDNLVEVQQRARPRARTQTLAAGLGVSAAALNELTGIQRASPTLGEPRPRPSSAAAGSVAGPMVEPNRCNNDLVERPQPKQLRVKSNRPRLSPNASLRSSRAGGRMRRSSAARPLRRLSLVAVGSIQTTDKLLASPPQPVPIKQQKLTPTLKRRSASVAMLSGRLSLAQLRKMVKRRAARRLSMVSQTDEAAPRTSESKQQIGARESSQEGEQKLSASAAGGRRQQRAEREQLERANAMVAPNGTKLTVTKPLAPLDDESQLYAIPRKSSKTTSKTNQITQTSGSEEKRPTASSETARHEAEAALGGDLDERGQVNKCREELIVGPALTASNQSLASCSSDRPATGKENVSSPSNGATIELDKRKLDSSSDDFVESLAGPLPAKKQNNKRSEERCNEAGSESESEGEDKDFCAPGYSVIKSRALISEGRADLAQETGKICTCSLDDHDPQRHQQASKADEVAELGARKDDAQSGCNEEHELLCLSAEGQDELDDSSSKLIRPRSVLGGANAELIAAQKNLAAAAAAKVQRDRQAKLVRSQQELGDTADRRTNFRELTVKTQLGTTTNSTFWLQHHQQHQTLVATAAARLQANNSAAAAAATSQKLSLVDHSAAGSVAVDSKRALNAYAGEMISAVNGNSGGGQSTLTSAVNQCRSGTNSVGLSDSSPSNNGADSDNSSQQTQTSGSMNTDETISSSTTALKQQPGGDLMATKRGDQQQSRPFGILSRILSHNNSSSKPPRDGGEGNAPKHSPNNNSSNRRTTNGLKRIVQTIANNAGARNEQVATKTISKQQHQPQQQQVNFSGSLSSSSALSSPSISTNGQSPNSTSDSTTGLAVQCHPASATTTALTAVTAAEDEGCALDDDGAGSEWGSHSTSLGLPNRKPQLDLLGSSRSRCPIVLGSSQSNGLPATATAKLDSATSLPPRLPPKSALMNSATEPVALPNYRAEYFDQQDALVNGLPRVSSYNQISPLSASNNINQGTEASLCSYHALNRSHMIQAEYSPHLPYSLGRYSIHETCDPSATGGPDYYRQYSNGGPTSVAYPNATPNYHHRLGPYYEGNSSLQNVSMVCHYAQDDSIFVSPDQLRQTHFDHFNQAAPNPHQMEQRPSGARPKSSLGSVFYVASSSSTPPPVSSLSNSQQNYGQRFSAINSQPISILKSSPNSAGRQQQIGMTMAANSNGNHTNQAAQSVKNGAHQINQIFDSSHLITQNSIYAPSNAFHQHPKCSELTVLPTSCHSANTTHSLSLVNCIGTHPSTNSPVKLKSDPNQELELDKPPKLPPKTTTTITTVGKLTRVSINSTASNGASAMSESKILTVKGPNGERKVDQERNEKSLC